MDNSSDEQGIANAYYAIELQVFMAVVYSVSSWFLATCSWHDPAR